MFERLKKTSEQKPEYWSARKLAKALEYSEYRHFLPVIEKAKEACTSSGLRLKDHFEDTLDMIELGKSATRQVPNILLSRYACYLIMQNADPSKEIVALGQTYFAFQTRRQELSDQLADNEKRLYVRGEVSEQNKRLFSTAKTAGVNKFGVFNDAGYRGLYGKPLAEIEKDKGIQKGELLDRSGSAELAANLFRITQTDEILKKNNIRGEWEATNTHNMVGGKVRQTIKDIGGVLPENLAPEKHIKELIKELKQLGTSDQKKIAKSKPVDNKPKSPLIVRIPQGASIIAMKKINRLLRSNPGLTSVIIEIVHSEGIKRLKLPYQVRVTKSLIDNIKRILAS